MIKPLPALFQLYGIQLTAYDLLNDKALWNTTLTLNSTNSFIFGQENASKVISPWQLGDLLNTAEQYASYQKDYNLNESGPPGFSDDFNVLPAGNAIYVSYQTANLEYPYVVNQSLCVYGSALFALDKNGTILWSIPTSTYPTAMAANNSTIYYGTRGGGFGSVGTGVAGGLALIALVFVFFKFFMAGTVSRARSRLGLNDNRNVILRFIAENPGSTMSDIARLTRINLGTVRYHLLILGINHRIVTSKTDDKSIRYFTNAGSYNSDEQFIISLMRRDVMRKVLGLLARSPGLTNIELSRELNIQESAVSRYMKELQEKGVVVRSNAQDIHDGRFSYSIKNEYKEKVAIAIERIGS
jgi:predicted transcriptional regulator